MGLHRWENSFRLAAFTVVTVLFSSYMSTTNCSIFSNAVSARFAFLRPSYKKSRRHCWECSQCDPDLQLSCPAKE